MAEFSVVEAESRKPSVTQTALGLASDEDAAVLGEWSVRISFG